MIDLLMNQIDALFAFFAYFLNEFPLENFNAIHDRMRCKYVGMSWILLKAIEKLRLN